MVGRWHRWTPNRNPTARSPYAASEWRPIGTTKRGVPIMLISIDRSIKARRLGYTALACPLRRRVMEFEVWAYRRRVRLYLIPVEQGETVMLELRDPPGTNGTRRSTPRYRIPGDVPAHIHKRIPLAELINLMEFDARADAAELRAEDAYVRALAEGDPERLRAITARVSWCEHATSLARAAGPSESVTAVLAFTLIVAMVATALGWSMGQGWWRFAAVFTVVMLAIVLWRVVASPRRAARRLVLPVMAESLTMLAPTLTELEIAFEHARDAKLAAAKLPTDADLRDIVERCVHAPHDAPPPPVPAA